MKMKPNFLINQYTLFCLITFFSLARALFISPVFFLYCVYIEM